MCGIRIVIKGKIEKGVWLRKNKKTYLLYLSCNELVTLSSFLSWPFLFAACKKKKEVKNIIMRQKDRIHFVSEGNQ